MRLPGPDTKYMMMWKGAWRPVVNMFDGQKEETTNPVHATTAVLFAGTCWVASVVRPGEIIERTDRDPNLREWEYID